MAHRVVIRSPECHCLKCILKDYAFSSKYYVGLKFVEKECFQITGWRFKNCVIQAWGRMWWCLAQIKACWLVQYFRPKGMGVGVGVGVERGGGGAGAWQKQDPMIFSFIFSSGGHLVQQSRTVWTISVEDHPRNILVKLLKNLSSSVSWEVF